VSIVIPTRDKRALLQTTIESIRVRTDYDRYEIIVVDNDSSEPDAVAYLSSLSAPCQVHRWSEPFNYSAINNFGFRHARGEQVLFLNNDVEVIRPDWLTALLEHAQRPEVGAVGAKLLYADGRIQHAGVVVGINRAAANAFRSWPGETIGTPRLADLTRNCSAVTGACMMVPRRVLETVGGFDETLRVVLNDVDLCLRIRTHGYLVVYTPHALLYHHEGSTRGRLHPAPDQQAFGEKWKDFLDRGDPYYNPNLTDRHDDWSIRVEEDDGKM
jgi:GT2 family glycosyltransferase